MWKKIKEITERLKSGSLLGRGFDVETQGHVSFELLRWNRKQRMIFIASTVIYAVARVCVIAVAFSTLRKMPESVYCTTWARYIPNVG